MEENPVLEEEIEPKKPTETISRIKVEESEILQVGIGRGRAIYCFREGDNLVVDFYRYLRNAGKRGSILSKLIVDFSRYLKDRKNQYGKITMTAGEERIIDDDFLKDKYETFLKVGDTVKLIYHGEGNLELRYSGSPKLKISDVTQTGVDEEGFDEKDHKSRERRIFKIKPLQYKLAKVPSICDSGPTDEELMKVINKHNKLILKAFSPPLEGINFESIDWEAGYTGETEIEPMVFDINEIKGENPEDLTKIKEILIESAGSANAIGVAIYRGILELDRKTSIKEIIRKKYGSLFGESPDAGAR